jgi:type IV pilus assembly protein PilB
MKLETQKGVEDILYEEGKLTPDQLSAVKFEHINTGRTAEEVIAERGYVSPQNLTAARGKLLNIPYVNLGGRQIKTELLDLVPEAAARKYVLIPFEQEGNVLKVAMKDPLDLQVIEFIEKGSGLTVEPFIAEQKDIESSIDEEYRKALGPEVSAALEEAGVAATKIEEQIEDITKAEEVIRDAPVARIVSTVLEYAVKARASDVHIEPEEKKTRIRYRIDGVLQERLSLPKKVHNSVVSRVKILSNLKIDERRLPQDGRFKIEVGDQEVDLRISTMPTSFGEKVAIRLLEGEGTVMTFAELGFRGISLARLEEALLKPHGIILVTGPTGSGKTVTIAAGLSKLNSVRINIVTLEDPVEIQIPGVNQVQINPSAGLTFASGLRSLVRQDPDVIMVGEIRDTETAELAIHAALTGHLVLSTLHTNSAAGALPRLMDMGVESFLLASTVNVVLAQRLVRTVCQDCRETYEAAAPVVEDIKAVLGPLFLEKMEKDGKIILQRGKGCKACGKTGFLGRTGIFEALQMSDRVRRLILEHQPTSEIHKAGVEEGMVTLKQDGYLKALEGQTTIEEVLRVARD